jgi:hypothetical protein
VKFYLISIITLISCSFSFGQINLINPSKAGVEILPEGIRGGFIGKTTDSSNIALGRDALRNNTLSHRNIAIGIGALKLFNAPNSDLNTSMIAIGHGSLANYNTSGHNLSIAIGKNALGSITQEASNNIVIGHFSAQNNRGDGKIVIGNRALTSGGTDTDGGIYIGNYVASFAPSAGSGNVVVGTRAMYNGGLYQNTIIGEEAGYGISSSNNMGIGNVMLGFKAGRNSTGDQKLYIENSDSTNTLIGGSFRLNRVGINRTNALIESTNRTLQVEGSALVTDVLQLPLGAGAGKILTSDATGNASWQSLPVSTNNWQVVGNNSARGGFNNNITDGTSNTILIGETNNQSGGQYNYAMGWGLELNGFANTVFGAFNSAPASPSTSWVTTDPLFTIGNGQSSGVRSNALLVQKNGVINIGVDPGTSTIFRLRVGGSISASSTIQASNLRATNLSGAGNRLVCTDANGNLIECISSYNVSAMGFQPQTNSAVTAANFQRDIINNFVSFANGTKLTEAYMYAPVELPDGFSLKQMAFHYKQSAGGTMTVRFKKVPKLDTGTGTSIIVSVSSSPGSNVLESYSDLASPEVIDNKEFYYYLYLEAGTNWLGNTMAARGVMFHSEKQK